MALAGFPMTTVTARRKMAEAAAAKPARKRSRKPAAKGIATGDTPVPPAPAAASKGITSSDTLALPAPNVADAVELDRLRAEFKRHREACLYFTTKAEFAGALDRAVARLGFDRAAMTPAHWVAAVESVVIMCDRCKGTGDYVWGGTVNGKPVHKATCYHCGGKGAQDIDDAHRNKVYLFHAIRAAAGF